MIAWRELALALILSLESLRCVAAAPIDLRLDALAFRCLETQLEGCRVTGAGIINHEQDGTWQLAWQLQRGFTPDEPPPGEGVKGGFTLFAYDGQDWTLLDARFDGWYSTPLLNEDGQLRVPGVSGGTGSYNIDRLYAWGDLGYAVYREGWPEIEMHGWLETLGDKLPPGLEIWNAVHYDFRYPGWGLSARTPLWRPTDANCCPSGGEAIVDLAIKDGRLIATAVRTLQTP